MQEHLFLLVLFSLLSISWAGELTSASLSWTLSRPGKNSPSSSQQLSFPDSLPESVPLFGSSKLALKLELNPDISPQQVFLLLSNDQAEAVFSFSRKGISGEYSLTLFPHEAAFSSQLSGSGEFQASVLIAGGDVNSPISWKVCPVSLRLSEHTASVLETSALPEIRHQFQSAQTRPLSAISWTFSLLTAVPLVLLFGAWAKIGVTWQFPAPSGVLSAVVFHGVLLSTLVLLVVYWICLDIFQAMQYLALCCVLLVFAGQHTLSMHVAQGIQTCKSSTNHIKSD